MSILQTITETQWLMEAIYLQQIYNIATEATEKVCVEAGQNTALDNDAAAEVRGNTAVIHVLGPIFRYENVFTQFFGGTSVETLAKDIQKALDNPFITGVLLNIDSPGGQVSGINELAELIYEGRKRKPIKAYVGNLAASAAYFIAAAAEEIILDDTASVGSIGVVTTIFPKKDGEGVEVVSSNAPNKRPDYSSEKGMNTVREHLDSIENVFISKVAKYRTLSFNKVIDGGNQGGMRVGKDAVIHKLCDRLGSFEGVIKEMNEKEVLTVPNVSEEDNKGAENATLAERHRVAEILAMGFPGGEAVVEKAVMEGMSPYEAAKMLLAQLKEMKKGESLYVAPMIEPEDHKQADSAEMLIKEINGR